jgi:threonine dehydratase
MTIQIATISDVQAAEKVIRQHLSPAPLIRSWPLEKVLGLSHGRRVWLKDYGWTPVGSFKLMGALNWVANNEARIGDRKIAADSSGNFASGISFAGKQYEKQVVVVMPDNAPQIKCDRTRSFGAEIRTYDISQDHITGDRVRMVREIAENEDAIQASPYDDPFVIAGNGVGGLEIVQELRRHDRSLSQFVCAVSGGGLMAGHALAIADGFPDADIVGVEPAGAADFQQSLQEGRRVRIDKPVSICDGLLSYDVGEHNWPILKEHVTTSVTATDPEIRQAMKWMYDNHGLKTEPSGVTTVAALLQGRVDLDGDGDLVAVVSGRNADESSFREWIAV